MANHPVVSFLVLAAVAGGGCAANETESESAPSDSAIRCGDGQAQGLETCDDGNVVSGDGCSARCRVEP